MPSLLPLGMTGRRWMDNIKMDLREGRWEVVDWMRLTDVKDKLRAVVSTVMNLGVP